MQSKDTHSRQQCSRFVRGQSQILLFTWNSKNTHLEVHLPWTWFIVNLNLVAVQQTASSLDGSTPLLSPYLSLAKSSPSLKGVIKKRKKLVEKSPDCFYFHFLLSNMPLQILSFLKKISPILSFYQLDILNLRYLRILPSQPKIEILNHKTLSFVDINNKFGCEDWKDLFPTLISSQDPRHFLDLTLNLTHPETLY